MEPKAIHLKDYKPAPFTVDSIDLHVDIRQTTVVTSKLRIIRRGAGSRLELNGDQLKLLSVRMNGRELTSDEFEVSADRLVILNVSDESFNLEIRNEIDPAGNSACEGFYQSGDQLCSQCEPEGFRRITYYLDRPDVMATFRTRMEADKKKYPFLLSNGNRRSAGELPEGRHFVEWEDPFRKPCYLFAMVAGDFDVARDSFRTRSGRKIELEIYVDKGNLFKTPHAMSSLKKAMKWDEEIFGLEYDLDLYMIVAVDSFNMGAMENKGLNIFNSTYTLADQKTATDHDFQNIESVIGHEYFHNWTGNRVTCRDWFQLTLKEGLTVYRDQEFSSDMLSRAVKRLEDVRLLKELQFAEDAGPMSHPIRPSSYIEINNFYTRTIYEKGAEVIRMIETLVGNENFRKGMDKYFELFDGQAVTTEDFVHAMELASGKDLTQFKNWYSRPGTPTIVVRSDVRQGTLTLNFEQKYPPTTWKVPEGNVLHLPMKIGFLQNGVLEEHLLELRELKQSFNFPIQGRPVLSLNRGFSAPVIVEYPYELSELFELMAHDTDAYCRYEATQKIYDHVFRAFLQARRTTGTMDSFLPADFRGSFGRLLADERIDAAFKSYLLELPTENALSQQLPSPEFDEIHQVHAHLRALIGSTFHDWFQNEYNRLAVETSFELSPEAYGNRGLRNQCLSYLVASGSKEGKALLTQHFERAANMTDELHALTLFIDAGVALDHFAVRGFYQKWKHDSLVMLKWFGALAAHSPKDESIKRVQILSEDPAFQKRVPNFERALYLQFARTNLVAFHQHDGSGYRFIGEKIKQMDQFNPQLASKSCVAFALINKVDDSRRRLMRETLQGIMEGKPSRDTFEVVSKYLAQ